MPELTHITEHALWDAAREMPTRCRTLQEEGFVHCSPRAQLPRVAAFLDG
nr:DUF952 domain-containing protein [Streptomyces sp. Ru62]